MRTTVRLTATLAVAVFALAFIGCGSNNKDKIVGKWKMVSASKGDEIETMKKMGLALAWVFNADGTFAMEVVSAEAGKEPSPLAGAFDKSKLPSGKYTLAMGDTVNFSDVKNGSGDKRLTTNITVNGDNMTMKDPDGSTVQLTRVK